LSKLRTPNQPAPGRGRSKRAGNKLADERALNRRLRLSDEAAPYPDAWMGARVLLKVQGLIAGYDGLDVVNDLNLEVRQGEIVVLLGPNGAGKSTTVNTIAGLLRPRGGSIEVDGAQVAGLDAPRLVGMGVAQVPQGRLLFGSQTVLDNLLLGGYTRRKRPDVQADIDEIYARFPILFERRAQVAGTLSGGQQQLLAIARALMARPRLLILDEPSVGLAPLVVRDIFDSIRQLNDRGTTILLVEQFASMALTLAHRGYVMERGRIVLEGSAASLRDNPKIGAAYLGV
jgi:branched-chain amino acid transport system ATP-binding protein